MQTNQLNFSTTSCSSTYTDLNNQIPNELPLNFYDMQNSNLNSCNENEEIFNLLKSWGHEDMYAILKESHIDIPALTNMREHHIKELLINFPLGIRIKFEQKLTQWQIEQKNLVPCTSNSLTNSNKISLIEILKETIEGKKLLHTSEENSYLTDDLRSALVQSITNYFIQKEINMGVEECENMSRQITTLFNSEVAEVYFQRQSGKKSKGMLYNRYNNCVSKLQKIQVKPKKKRCLLMEQNTSTLSYNLNDNIEENAENICQQLRFNSFEEEDIILKWSMCLNYRLKNIIENTNHNITDIFEQWPAFKQSFGPKLISIDFNHMYPNATDVFLKFDRFSNQFLDILEKQKYDNYYKTFLKDYKELPLPVSANIRHIAVLVLIHYLLKPTTKICKKNSSGKNIWTRFTIKDSQDSFILFASSLNAVEQLINEKRRKCYAEKLSIQPFIFTIGESFLTSKSFHVYLDGIIYNFPSVLSALDCTFKIFSIFNLKYPLPCEVVWSFIQSYFYGMGLPNVCYPAIDLLINKLNNIYK